MWLTVYTCFATGPSYVKIITKEGSGRVLHLGAEPLLWSTVVVLVTPTAIRNPIHLQNIYFSAHEDVTTPHIALH